MAEKTAQAPGKKVDWITPVALIGGGGMLAVGAYLIFKKPSGVGQGGEIKAVFKFDFNADEGTYIFQISFGNILLFEPLFDHLPGMTFTQLETLEAVGQYEVEVLCELPAAINPQVYDAEAIIRTPDMGEYDYLIKKVTKDAIRVVE